VTSGIRIFICAPGDVRAARYITTRVVDRVAQDYAPLFSLDSFIWQYDETGHLPDPAEPPSRFDIVVLILSSRAGRAPLSATEWVYADALQAVKARGFPDILVYRSRETDTSDAEHRDSELAQLAALEAFLSAHVARPGVFPGIYSEYASREKFVEQFERHLRQLLDRRLAERPRTRPLTLAELAETRAAADAHANSTQRERQPARSQTDLTGAKAPRGRIGAAPSAPFPIAAAPNPFSLGPGAADVPDSAPSAQRSPMGTGAAASPASASGGRAIGARAEDFPLSPASTPYSGGRLQAKWHRPAKWPLTVVALVSLLSVGLVFRHEIALWAAGLLKLFRSVPPPLPGAPQAERDLVDVSVFAPDAAQAGEEILLQVFLHWLEQAAAVRDLAKESDRASSRRGVATLETEVERGRRVDIVLECPGANIDEPAQYLIWRGEPRACQYLVTLPDAAAKTNLRFKIRVLIDGLPVGTVRFTLPVLPIQQAAKSAMGIKGESGQRYRRAFLSYASPDRAEVIKRAQALRALGIGFFQDLLSLEPGDAWQKRLYEEIDACDVFLLFWSSAAAQSQWVIREAEYAMNRRLASAEDSPDIMPIVLEGPPVPAPPPSLEAIHFNDALRYVIAAVEAEKKSAH